MQVDAYPEQETRGSLVEGERYTSKEFALAEWEGMWTKVWLLLGRESEMPNPGDWQMEEVGPESILMVRLKLSITFVSTAVILWLPRRQEA